MSRKKIKVRIPQKNKNNVQLPSQFAELATLLKQSLAKTEELVALNQKLMTENKKLNEEVSHILEAHDNKIIALEKQMDKKVNIIKPRINII